jgi:hypothetical protein
MFTLIFSNSARPNFPTYEKAHGSLDSVALEILRVHELLEGSAAAHNPIVTDHEGKEVARVPTARRRREVRDILSAPKEHDSGAVTQTLRSRDVFEVTEIDGRYVASRWAGTA